MTIQEGQNGVLQEYLGQGVLLQNGLAAQFKNPSLGLGKQTLRARSVTASLVFKDSEPESAELHIDKGVWIGHYANRVTFEAGGVFDLLVAMSIPNGFVTFRNPNDFNPTGRRYHSRHVAIRGPERRTIQSDRGEVEITLIDSDGITVFHGAFDIVLDETSRMLVPEWLPPPSDYD